MECRRNSCHFVASLATFCLFLCNLLLYNGIHRDSDGLMPVGSVLEKGVMFRRIRPLAFVYRLLCVALILGLAGACSPQYYKEDADKEVYQIIDNKWQDGFGQKVNYRISDVEPSPNDIQTENLIPPSGPLSLAHAVAIATAQSREYQRRKEDLYETALRLTAVRHEFARRWFGTFEGGYIRDSDDESVDYTANLGFTQLLADGADISANIALNWLRFLTGDPRTTLGSVLTATVTQPLLRGAGRKIVQEKLTLAERRLLYNIRDFNRYRKTFVVDTVNAYYGVLRQRDAVTNAENDYNRRVESKERLELEAKAGRKPPFEVDQAEQDMLRARDTYVDRQQNYQQALDLFKIRLALPTDANVELDQNELKALEEMGITQPDYTLSVAIETALLRRLDLANTADQIGDAARTVILTADGLRPDLDITGGIGVDSRGKTDFGTLQFHEGDYSLGLRADLPFDRKIERNEYRLALIDLEEAQRRYDESVDNVKLDVRQAYRDLQEAAERYGIQKNSLQLAEKRVESTTLLLDAGRATTRDLLESQDALLEAQDNVATALVAHLGAKLNFFKDVGILQVRPDGMWVQ